MSNLVLVGVASVIVSVSAVEAASRFPEKPIRIVVPAAAGGGTSIVARLFGDRLASAWGQPVVVDNRPGAGGVLGAEIVARSPPDGHTMMMGYSAAVTIAPLLHKQLGYRPIDDFAPVSQLASMPLILLVHPSLPSRTVGELVSYARSRPGRLDYSSAGNGSGSHLAAELLKNMAGIDIVHVPYKGAAQALTDVVGGQIAVHFSGILIALPHVRTGRLRALGVSGARRLTSAPDIPTISASGLPGYEVDLWYGMLFPAGVGNDIVDRTHRELMEALKSPELRLRLLEQGAEPAGTAPAAFAEKIRSDTAKWASLVRQTGMKLD